jgi:molybdopterin converting factor small subunit
VAIVYISSGLRQYTDGVDQLEVEPGQIRAVICSVTERFPELRSTLDKGVAVSIDGVIIQNPLLQPVGPTSEVHFLPQVAGGATTLAGN